MCTIFQRRFNGERSDDTGVFPSPSQYPPSVRPTDKPSFFCNFRARSPGNPWKIRDPTETVLLSRRVTTRVSGFVVLLSLLSNVLPTLVVSSRGREQNCDRVTCRFARLEEISVEFIQLAPPPPLPPESRSSRDSLPATPYIAITFHALERQSRDRLFLFFFLSPTDSR